MECPKCGFKINDDTTVCPNCKKVLKLICPICKTVNKTNTCTNCGFIIVNKCHQCGKINPTIAGRCSKCGFDTNVSAILQGSNIDEFACVSIDFPNLEDMKQILGSSRLFEKFKTKLNGLISDYVKSIGVKRQIIGSTHIIRFNKDYTYSASAKNAVKASVDILNLITHLNHKLTETKDSQLKCNIAILKRNAYASNEDYKSGINIQLLYQNIGAPKKLLKNLQLITDGSIYEVVGNDLPMNSIGMVRVKNQSIFLYELELKDFIKEDNDEDTDINDIQIPDIIQDQQEIFENEDTIYDMDGINFDEIHCNFSKEITQGLSSKLTQFLMSKRRNIIVVKGKQEFFPRTLEVIDKIKQNKIFQNVIKVTCYDDMKYKPYGFFNDLLFGLYGFNTTGKLKDCNNFSVINTIDKSGYLKDLVNLNVHEVSHPEEVRTGLFEAFEKVINNQKKSLVIIENIEKIDDTSFELLQELLKKFEQNEISYLIFADKDFSLHKTSHFLLRKQEYTEITIKPTPIKTFIEANANLCKNILDSFYMQKISKNTKGSQMYFMQALVHLIDLGVFAVEKGSLVVDKSETVVFPTTLDELIQKRLIFLKNQDENLFKFFACILLIGPQLDLASIKLFNSPKVDDYLSILDNKGFIYSANGVIQVQNYNLYYENLLKIMTFEEKRSIANYLITFCFKDNTANPILAKLYSLIENNKNEFVQWENLSNINRSLGDFSAYLNCSLQVLKLLDNNINEYSGKSIDEYRIEVYENIASLLYKYTPEKIANITQTILDNLEKGMKDKKVINLCNKIMQGCIISGNYNHALLMAHKILSRFENADINPNSPEFNINALMISLVKIEILFNVGNLEECIELGEDLFNIIENNRIDALQPKSLPENQFYDLITNSAGYVMFAKILQLKEDTFKFCELIERVLTTIPNSFKMFADIDNLIHNKPIITDIKQPINQNEKFAKFLINIIKAFSIEKSNPENFATTIYEAKLGAKENNLHQLELFCDLMIGYSYFKLGKFKKSASIYNSVLETSMNHGLKNITYLCWYLIAELSLTFKDLGTASGLINNAIVELENNRNGNMYILMLYKNIYAKILKMKNEDTQADFCYNQAKQISERYHLNLK